MYLPRAQLSNLYSTLLTTHSASQPPLLILTALTVDALCATRILTSLLKRDFIPHTVVPVSGYGELAEAGERLVQPLLRQRGGDGGRVVCIGCGGGVDMSEVLLGLDGSSDGAQDGGEGSRHGVEVWLVDAQRPWNLENLFNGGAGRGNGVHEGKILESYRPGNGGVIAWCDSDIETELDAEREAYFALRDMPEIDEQDLEALAGADEEEVGDDAAGGEEDPLADDEAPSSSQTKRKRVPESGNMDSDADMASDDERPRRRRRSNSGTPIPSSPGGNPMSNQLATSLSPTSQGANGVIPSSPPPPKTPSLREQKRALLTLRRKHEATLNHYYDAGSWATEPVSSMLYSLASDLGREDNEVLWLAIVGVESVALSPLNGASEQTGRDTDRGRRGDGGVIEMVKTVLRDEVRRLNPPSLLDGRTQSSSDSSDTGIPTHARSATDTSIRLSPEPRFLLVRHWSLYDSMLHSPYLATRLHVWNEGGLKRLHKLLAKMGISLAEAGKGYLHLDMEIKRSLNKRLGKFAEVYGLEGLVPGDDGPGVSGRQAGWGFVRSWGWRGTLSAVDVATVVSAILEVGPSDGLHDDALGRADAKGYQNYNTRVAHGQQRQAGLPSPPHSSDSGVEDAQGGGNSASEAPDWSTRRFFAAYDALAPNSNSSHSSSTHAGAGLATLLHSIPIAQDLARAILRTGSALISKKQIRHLRAFRMGVVREGPDVPTFTHPGALVKLAGWVREAVGVLEAEKGGHKASGSSSKAGKSGEGEALVLAALDEGRGVYVVVGLGGGSGLGQRVKSKAEIREKEEKAKRKVAAKLAKKAERSRKKAEARLLRRERLAANGDVDSDGDSEAESDATESTVSSSSSSSSHDSDSAGEDSDAADLDDDSTAQRKKRSSRRRGGPSLNRFGQAFQEVVEETGARVRIDSFEHSVVEVRKEDLAGFLEGLSLKSVVG
ncbi:hypothetical protein LTR85_011280 [Meristemomyces frigidus]|nr:hypothetical protein LTR85_011280 [Meristemomyces frigidus]